MLICILKVIILWPVFVQNWWILSFKKYLAERNCTNITRNMIENDLNLPYKFILNCKEWYIQIYSILFIRNYFLLYMIIYIYVFYYLIRLSESVDNKLWNMGWTDLKNITISHSKWYLSLTSKTDASKILEEIIGTKTFRDSIS